jgi:hypothetical protein
MATHRPEKKREPADRRVPMELQLGDRLRRDRRVGDHRPAVHDERGEGRPRPRQASRQRRGHDDPELGRARAGRDEARMSQARNGQKQSLEREGMIAEQPNDPKYDAVLEARRSIW